ncbi:TRAP transporter substrate-binding protein [Chloroflexota bacterium]
MKKKPMLIKYVILGFLALSMISLAACTATPEEPTPAAPVTLRYSSNFAPTTPQGARSQWLMDEVTKRTGGQIKFEAYWSSTLANPKGQLEAVQGGAADIIDSSAVYWVGKFPVADLCLLFPFGPSDPELVIKARRQVFDNFPALADTYAQNNMKLLAETMFTNYSFLGKEPINGLQDLKGKKVALIGKYFGMWMEPVGLVPVVMPSSQRYEALQNNLVDIDLLNVSAEYTYKLYEHAKYGVNNLPFMCNATDGVFINLDRFNSFSPKIQQILMDVGRESESFLAKSTIAKDAEYIESMKQSGVTYTDFPEKDLAEWVSMIEDVPAIAAAEKEQQLPEIWDIVENYQYITGKLGFKWLRTWGVKP